MTAKDYLRQLRRLSLQIANKEKQIKSLQEHMTFLRGISYDTDRVQTSPRDAMSESVARLVDLKNEAEADILKLEELRDDCIRKINGLSKREYIAILHARYVDGMNFEKISCDIGYSYYRTCRMHGEALEEFEKKYLRK